MIAALLVALTSLLGGAVAAEAHQINLTNARLALGADRTVEVEVAMRGSDIDRAAGTRLFDDASGLVQSGALAAASAPILAYIKSRRKRPFVPPGRRRCRSRWRRCRHARS